MLHQIPDSTERARLLAVVEMQRQLMEALCNLPEAAVVDQTWLQGVWPGLPAAWIKRFWENDKGNRATWITTIAAANTDDKQTISNMVAEQLRFADLYHNPPTVRLTKHDWKPTVFAAVNQLLKSFYDPYFYKEEGFHNPGGEKFHKEHFIAGFTPRVKICPYTDNIIQDTKLDHFIPKDQYPMLSCHPDNLIPCSTDSNSGSHKGTTAPLDPDEADQAGAWFHPRWRNAVGKYRLTFPAGPAPQPQVVFEALAAGDQLRLNNMERMFGLSEFWGGFLDDEVQIIASDVQGLLQFDGKQPTEASVRACVLQRASQERNKIGKDALAIVKSFFYEHIAHTQVLLDQVIRVCVHGT
ncbi:hypothetical protein [Geobacter sp. AOG2]|uniref:hypothetical protein n=1 Tax=Geobacter sp. AOG2 TaxID=1566347 RepID=UPI001CC6141E|nr:hypothetical protein [Geobacter sp. AOG2]GFE60797.1 hypothetical protein AOG2_13850 [Geobacter sp. AOG2]